MKSDCLFQDEANGETSDDIKMLLEGVYLDLCLFQLCMYCSSAFSVDSVFLAWNGTAVTQKLAHAHIRMHTHLFCSR